MCCTIQSCTLVPRRDARALGAHYMLTDIWKFKWKLLGNGYMYNGGSQSSTALCTGWCNMYSMCEVTQECLFSLGGGGEVVCVWIRVWLMTSQLNTQNMRSDYLHPMRCESCVAGYTNRFYVDRHNASCSLHLSTH